MKFGSGITGIVGPNGCGKSNVADAIRWVLGEQSAKLLRGSSMQDVIFNGTGKRKMLSLCEVSLYFDNTEDSEGKKLFPTLDFKEVVISRKLFRSGDSEYLINKEQSRLRDISELLREGNMGKEGYSIIGQGRIDELLSAKAEDRRAIFEEAAGISKFKVKKVESERKLARAEENLLRVADILREKQNQLEPLTRQSANALRYKSLKDQLRHHEVNIYIHQYDTAAESKKVINDRLDIVVKDLSDKNELSEKTNIEFNETMAALNKLDITVSLLNEELLELTVGLERDAGEIKLLNERAGYLQTQIERITQENFEAKKEHAEAISQIEKDNKLLKERAVTLKELVAVEEKISAEYIKVVEELVAGESEADKRHLEVIAAMEKLADIKANMGRLLAEKVALKQGLEDLTKRLEFLLAKKKTDEKQQKEIVKEIASLTANKEKLLTERQKATINYNESTKIIADCATQLDKLTGNYHSSRSRLKMFSEMRESNEALGVSVQKLIKDAKTNSNLSGRIEGVVAQLIKVKPGFDMAVGAALGNAVQNIVTKTEAEAKFLISYLKEKKYGQVTFLPVSSIKPRSIHEHFKPLLKMDGCLGLALDAISYNNAYEPVMRGLLGGTVFVKDMDVAVELAKKSGYGFRIVTLEGDIIQSSGSITGGSKRSDLNNIFAYEREIETLTKVVSESEKEIAAINSLREAKLKIQTESQVAMADLNEKIHNIDVQEAAKQEASITLEQSIVEENNQVELLSGSAKESYERIAAIDKDINSVSKLEELIAGDRAQKSVSDAQDKAKFETLRKRRDELHGESSNAKLNVSNLKNDISNLNAEIERLQAHSIILAERLEYNASQLIENKEVAAKVEKELKAFSQTAKTGDSEKVTKIRSRLAGLTDEKVKSQEKLELLDKTRNSLIEQIQILLEKKSQEEQFLLKVDTDIDYMQQRVLEEYDLTYGACLAHKDHEYNALEGSEAAAKLKRQIQNLGNVNLDAIDQCRQVYDEYHALNIQKDDLVTAKTELEKIIADLSSQMLSMFSHQFEEIRTNFTRIFRELFNGGTADLILLDSENPLEAGIDIVAQPPEKKLQTISLLSGGERALTAIAILFAILSLRPMPFCVLDEIEAALDDANAGRFARYLRRFAGDTQFIVITHRKPTMELADSLYGVTMEEKGVSKIVSVKLSEAVNVAEPA